MSPKHTQQRLWPSAVTSVRAGDSMAGDACTEPPAADGARDGGDVNDAAATCGLLTPEPLAPLDVGVRSPPVPMRSAPPCHGVTPGAPQYVHLLVRRKADGHEFDDDGCIYLSVRAGYSPR